jgi:HEAT repeat protein
MTPIPGISLKAAVTVAAVIGSLVLELVLHLLFGISVAYTHFFYIALVAAGIWYRTKALFLAVLLGAVHAGIEFSISGYIPPEALIRAVAFVLVTLIAALSAERLPADREGMPERQVLRNLRFWQSVAIREGRAVDVRNRASVFRPLDFFRRADGSGELVKALGDRNSDIRNRAAARLGEIRDPSAVPALATALRDEDSGVRWKAAEALGKIGEPAIGALTEALGHPDPDIRWKAAVALGITGNSAAIDPLIRALSDEDLFVQTRAAGSLSRFGDSALEPLLAVFAGGDQRTKTGTAIALGRLGSMGAVHALIAALGDSDAGVRGAAASAVVLQGERAVGPLIGILGDRALQDAAVPVLARIGRPAVEPLVAALDSADPQVRTGAARALGMMDDPPSLRALVLALGVCAGMEEDRKEEKDSEKSGQ